MFSDCMASTKTKVMTCELCFRIPHYFGMKVPPMIRSSSEVREKLQLLEALGDIEAAMTFLKNAPLDDGLHPADRNYNNLACDIKTLSHDSDEFKVSNSIRSLQLIKKILFSIFVITPGSSY